METEHFRTAIQYFLDNKEFDKKFELIKLIDIEKERFVLRLVKILESDYTFVIDEIKKTNYQALSEEKETELQTYLNFILNITKFIKFYSATSYEFNMIFIGITEGVSNILRILKDNDVHEIIKKLEIENIYKIYLDIIRSSIEIFDYIIPFYNQFKEIFSSINSKVLFELSKTLESLFYIDANYLLDLIPFVLNYDDDNEEETHNQLRDMYENKSITIYELLGNTINTVDHKSRKVLNIFK
jgi:hypothetical protein